MVLCGISSRFQLLSPSEGQVDYALLTRSPLRLIEASFRRSSFDLHVLSTPPAFILSQDRTLKFKFVRSGQNNVGLSQLFYPLLLGLVLFRNSFGSLRTHSKNVRKPSVFTEISGLFVLSDL